ncbi:hypothetical protein INT44_002370 [Umbelopsis vinacea]|uniref:Alginate lyase domain-containing protein n=1 Tax=Umbelopsis vinacea TaxID=44442 RepID=A0A8H7Q3R7_9FUNG|nr:hypothetical protein INT44_002370 [Umbelopsis vinacea]
MSKAQNHLVGASKPFQQIDRIYPAAIDYYKQRTQLTPTLFKKNLARWAESSVLNGPYSVTYKKMLPPSGDAHDYYSYRTHWWPACPKNATVQDPTHECPYKSIRGQTNPDVYDIGDHQQLQKMAVDVMTLAVAWSLLEEDRFAVRAAMLLRNWFINPETRMNPNAAFAQTTRGPGEWTGSGSGIFDLRYLLEAANAAAILRQSPAWSEEDHQAVITWFRDLTQWLLTSHQGKSAAKRKNNLKIWYYAELAGFYMLTEDTAKANETIHDYLTNMYPQQIAHDGNQPSEMGHSGHRLSFNLEGMLTLAKIGDEIGVDIWHRKTDQGATILTAVKYLLSHNLGAGPEVWHLEAAVRAKYGNDVFLNIKVVVSASNRNPGLQSLSNDHPPIEAFNAWPSAKKPANPSDMNIKQHLSNLGHNRGIGPKSYRGDAMSLPMACFPNVVIGLITMFSLLI